MSPPALGSTITFWSSSRSTPASISFSRARATSRPATTTPRRTQRSRFGAALDVALGDRRGIARYGDAVVPMDDALARAAVDLGGRPNAELKLELDPGMATHMLASFAQAARASINVEAAGRDGHHVAEAAFKAVGRALRAAVRSEGAGLPSTKGLL